MTRRLFLSVVVLAAACARTPPRATVAVDVTALAPPATEVEPGKSLFTPFGVAEVKGVFERRAFVAVDCHTAAGPEAPTRGRVTGTFLVEPAGTLGDVRVEPSTPALAAVADCVAAGLRASRLPFKGPAARAARVEWTFSPREIAPVVPAPN